MKPEDLQHYNAYLAANPRFKQLPPEALFAHLRILRGTHPLANDAPIEGEDILGGPAFTGPVFTGHVFQLSHTPARLNVMPAAAGPVSKQASAT
jgi:hypothetical protein